MGIFCSYIFAWIQLSSILLALARTESHVLSSVVAQYSTGYEPQRARQFASSDMARSRLNEYTCGPSSTGVSPPLSMCYL